MTRVMTGIQMNTDKTRAVKIPKAGLDLSSSRALTRAFEVTFVILTRSDIWMFSGRFSA
jgi:hypothetical protein